MSGLTRLAPGSLFAADFRVVKPLAEGAMGAVYVVEQLSTKKPRALKLMQPELVASPDLRRRFEREAQVAASIKSAHVVETIGAGVDAETGIPWLAMELLEGDTLADRVEKHGPIDLSQMREAVGQLGHALGKAHEASIVHRDLKPENLFLGISQHRGVPFTLKILDFGIARITHEVRTTSNHTRGSIGTPLWWAPEQASPDGQVGPWTDVWPLGLIAFWALTGRYFWKSAYVEGSSLQMMAIEQFVSPLPLASKRAADLGLADRLPPGFDEWFAKTVAREVGDRFPEAASACDAFERLCAPASQLGHDRTAMGSAPSFAPPSAAASRPSASFPSHAPSALPASSGPFSPAAASIGPRSSAPDVGRDPTIAIASADLPQGASQSQPDVVRSLSSYVNANSARQSSPPSFAAATGVPLHTSTTPGAALARPRKSNAGIIGGAIAVGVLLIGFGVVKVAFAPSKEDVKVAVAEPKPTAAPTSAAPDPSATAPVVIATAAGAAPEAPTDAPAADDPPADVTTPRGGAGHLPAAKAQPDPAPLPAAATPVAVPVAAPVAVAYAPALTPAEFSKAIGASYGHFKKGCWADARKAAPKGGAHVTSVRLTLNIDAAGNVTGATGAGGEGFPGLAQCVAGYARGIHFRPTAPVTSSATIDFK